MENIDFGLRDKPKRPRKKAKPLFAPALGIFASVTAALSLVVAVFFLATISETGGMGLMGLVWSLGAFGSAVLM